MVVTPASLRARRAASLSSTTKPKWRLSSAGRPRPFVRAMNWSPRSMNAVFSEFEPKKGARKTKGTFKEWAAVYDAPSPSTWPVSAAL